MSDTTLRHKTFGISLPVESKARAEARAVALGLTFSRYVNLCLEAELTGFAQIIRDDRADLERALARARDYMARKTRAVEFEQDVGHVLARTGWEVERFAAVGPYRCDYRVTDHNGALWLLECRFNIRQNYALALGQCLLLRAVEAVNRVVLVVPYLEGFDTRTREQFEAQNIHLSTPDTLGRLLAIDA